MNLNESIVEDAALEWFGELGYAVGHGPQLAPACATGNNPGHPIRLVSPARYILSRKSRFLRSIREC